MTITLVKIPIILGALASTLTAFCSPAFATETTTNEQLVPVEQLITNGKKMAQEKCASCHSIEVKGESPNEAAPPFRTFASKWPLQSLEEALAEGIVTGHEEMPEVIFTPPEIVAFLEFLGSLQKN